MEESIFWPYSKLNLPTSDVFRPFIGLNKKRNKYMG